MDKKKDEGVAAVALEKTEGWWNGIVGEFKRVSWPNRNQLAKMTIAAIITSGIVGAIIVAYDFSLAFVYDQIVSLVSRIRP
jgi:preprotein translocase SecE subunit